MSTDNLKIETKEMDRFRILLARKFGKYHGYLTPEGTKAIKIYNDGLEKELEDKQHGIAAKNTSLDEVTDQAAVKG